MSVRNINRRSFIGKAGTVAAAYTFFPASAFPVTPVGILSGNPASSHQAAVVQPQWWIREPLRIIELEEGYDFGKKFDLLKALGANMEHATRFTDTSPGTSFLDAHNLFSGQKVNFGSLDEYLREAHARGIRVVIYYNVHAIEINYARRHPEWQQIKDDGTPIEDVYSVDSSFCINSPWRDEVFSTLDKMAGYGIDGVFYDGPIFFAQGNKEQISQCSFFRSHGKIRRESSGSFLQTASGKLLRKSRSL